MNRLQQIINGSSLTARVVRSSGLTVVGFGAANLIRLATNLILTRLLFPEAFGHDGSYNVGSDGVGAVL